MWSRDGRLIAFFSGNLGGGGALMLEVATGVAEAEPIVQTPTLKYFTDWSSDGQTLVFDSNETGRILQAVPSDGWNYAVSADGQRILAARATNAATTPITVVVNWPALLTP